MNRMNAIESLQNARITYVASECGFTPPMSLNAA